MKKQINFHLLSKHRQFLYGFSALWVVLYHFCTRIPKIGIITPLHYLQEAGACGVEIFLLLTGFGLYHSMHSGCSAGTFYKKRFMRVFLPAFITMALYNTLVDESFIVYLGSTTFLGYWFGMETIWYVAFILTMYMVYPLIYRIQCRKPAILWILLLVSAVAGYVAEGTGIEINVLRGITRIPIFLIGCIIAPYVEEKKDIPRLILPMALAASAALACVWYGKDWHQYYYVLRSALFLAYGVVVIILVCVVAEWILKHKTFHVIYRCFAFCGAISLEMYLLYERLWISMDLLLPGFTSDPFSFIKLDLAAIALTVIFSVILQKVTGWIIDVFASVKLPVSE